MVPESIKSGKLKNATNICKGQSNGKQKSYLFNISQFAGSSLDELQHIRQAVGFLVHFLKPRLANQMIVLSLGFMMLVTDYMVNLHRCCIKKLKNLLTRSQMNYAR